MGDAHMGGGQQLSIDMPWRELRDRFYDAKARRCLLCDEYIGSLAWSLHNGFAPHSAREGVATEMLQAHNGTPAEFCDAWWDALDTHPNFRADRYGWRIAALSPRNILYLAFAPPCVRGHSSSL